MGATRPHNPAARGELRGATAPWQNRSQPKKNNQTLNTKLRILPNREKTRIIDLRRRAEKLEFLGDSFSYENDLSGSGKKYGKMQPSKQALAREREKLRQMSGYTQCAKPLPELVEELNIHLRGWANYFSKGYTMKAFRQINNYV